LIFHSEPSVFSNSHYIWISICYPLIVDRAFPALIESAKRSQDMSLDLMPRLRLRQTAMEEAMVFRRFFANVAENRAVE